MRPGTFQFMTTKLRGFTEILMLDTRDGTLYCYGGEGWYVYASSPLKEEPVK